MRTPRKRILHSVVISAFVFLPLAQLQAVQFSGLVKRLPPNANTLVLIDMEKILASPLAKEEGWRDHHSRSQQAGITIVPPGTTRFAMGSQMDLEFFQPIWDAAVADVNYETSIPKLAVRMAGSVDKIEGRDAAALADDTFVVKFGPRLVGAMSPANRQVVTRWIKHVYSPVAGRSLSEYLGKALTYGDEVGTPIIMAIDFENAFSSERIRKRLESFEFLKTANVNLDVVAQTLSSIHGVTLGISIRERAYGKLKAEFGNEISPDPELAKKLLIEVLQQRGAMIDDFVDWKAQVKGKQFSIEGPLTPSGMRRVFSVLDAPDSFKTQALNSSEMSSEQSQEQLIVVSSQGYFKSVQTLLDDLRDKRPSGGFKTAGQIGMWYGKYAKKIDRQPMANVDEELLDYGGWVSASLRDSHSAMQSIGANKRARTVNVDVPTQYVSGAHRWGRAGFYGGAGGAGWSTRYYTPYEQRRMQQSAITRISAEERVKGYASANDIMKEVDNATSDIRRKMTAKYNVDF